MTAQSVGRASFIRPDRSEKKEKLPARKRVYRRITPPGSRDINAVRRPGAFRPALMLFLVLLMLMSILPAPAAARDTFVLGSGGQAVLEIKQRL